MAWYGEAALVVGESERPVVELGPQRAVLLKERGEGLSLAPETRRWCADSARWASSGRHVDHRDRRRVMISM